MQVGREDDFFDEFVEQHGRQHATQEERQARGILFHQHHTAVREHNAQPKTPYKLAINHLADWTAAEYRGLLGLRRSADARRAIADLRAGRGAAQPHHALLQCAAS